MDVAHKHHESDIFIVFVVLPPQNNVPIIAVGISGEQTALSGYSKTILNIYLSHPTGLQSMINNLAELIEFNHFV